MQAYSDPKRASNPYALPNIEVFWHEHVAHQDETDACLANADSDEECPGQGYYWWSCFPGCLPDGDAIGPFETEKEALTDAQEVANGV